MKKQVQRDIFHISRHVINMYNKQLIKNSDILNSIHNNQSKILNIAENGINIFEELNNNFKE